MKITRSTTLQLVGRGALNLGPADHLATGGEGAIYRQGNTVIKLYLDDDKMAREGIADKIDLLSHLDHPYLIAPRGLVTNAKGKPVGWYMDYAPGEPLARAFTNDWRKQAKFGTKESSTVASRMLDLVHYAHDHQAVMADANELNWTIVPKGPTGPEPRALDVDSWAIGKWPARAIMPSIRDWHTTGMTTASDYFAWGIVTFQLYTGLHPYKGTLDGYKPGELERRMRANASVFTPGVRLNRAVRDFSTIPTPLLDWYEATFQAGSRTDPPSPLQRTAAPSRRVKVARVVVTAQGALHYDRLYDGSSVPAERIFPCGIVLLSSGALYDLATGRTIGATPSGEVIRLPEGWLVARIVHDQVDAKLINDGFTAIPVRCAIQAKRLVQANGRLFAVTCEGLTELSLLMLGKPMLVAKRTWGALASTTWFDGVGIQDTMGSTYLIAPYDTEACAQIRVPELDGLRPIMARAGQRFVSVIALDKHGDYRKFEFSFDHTYQSYTLWQGQADSAELNQAILPRGVVVTIVRDGELVIFVPRNGDTKRVPDRDATTELQLARWDERVLAIRDGSVLSLKLT